MLGCVPIYTNADLNVGAVGFELTTYGTQNRRATKLRYAPKLKDKRHLSRLARPTRASSGHYS